MKRVQVTADGAFLRAFDIAIETAHEELASAGCGEEAIWAAFRRATETLAGLSADVEQERQQPRIPHRSRFHRMEPAACHNLQLTTRNDRIT